MKKVEKSERSKDGRRKQEKITDKEKSGFKVS